MNTKVETIEINSKYSLICGTTEPTAKLVKSGKTIKNYRFQSEAARYDWCLEMSARIMQDDREQADRQAKAAEMVKNSGVKVGTIFVNSWGYEQTNIDFYQVVSMTAKTVTVRKIRKEKEYTEFLQGKCTPIVGDFCGKEMRKTLKSTGSEIYICMDHGWCDIWDGQPENWTAYA